jgi:hypothetical protein
MSTYCNAQSQQCASNCCDRFGICPEVSNQTCYYAYGAGDPSSTSALSPAAIAGISVGCLIVLGLIPTIIWLRKRQKIIVNDPDQLQSLRAIPKSTKVIRSEKHMRIEINAIPAGLLGSPAAIWNKGTDDEQEQPQIANLSKYEPEEPQAIYSPGQPNSSVES